MSVIYLCVVFQALFVGHCYPFFSVPSGYAGALYATSQNEFNTGYFQRVLLDQVTCNGNEPVLSDCLHTGIGNTDCNFGNYAGVICETGVFVCVCR